MRMILFLESEADKALDKKRYYAEEFKKDPTNIELAKESGRWENIRRMHRNEAKKLRRDMK